MTNLKLDGLCLMFVMLQMHVVACVKVSGYTFYLLCAVIDQTTTGHILVVITINYQHKVLLNFLEVTHM